jgi:hypothetical protein
MTTDSFVFRLGLGVEKKYTDVESDMWQKWTICDEQGWAYLHVLDVIALHCRELDDKSFVVGWDTAVTEKSALLWRFLVCQRSLHKCSSSCEVCSSKESRWVQRVRAVQIDQNRESSRRQTQFLVESYVKAERREAQRCVHENQCKEEKRRLFPVSPHLL